MSSKVIKFYYKRDSPPHSEYAVREFYSRWLADYDSTVKVKQSVIQTSTASIFTLLRAFCLKNNIELKAKYESTDLILDKNMRMEDWSKCPDFNSLEDDLDILLRGDW